MQTKAVTTRKRILESAHHIMAGRGYVAVGLNEVLAEAGVPKGSFYHWFSSRDSFGHALVVHYFDDYLATTDRTVARQAKGAVRLLEFWQRFYEMQTFDRCTGKCLVVKLGAEVADLSESMRLALNEGIDAVVERVERMISEGLEDGSVEIEGCPHDVARSLYDAWIGASVIAKINRDTRSLDLAMTVTRQRLHI